VIAPCGKSIHFRVLLLIMSFDLTSGIFMGLFGIVGIGVALFGKSEFRWGRTGQGPRMQPQWIGRVFFAIVGGVMLYVAVTGFR
jgi:hypothetical protein